MLGSFGAPELIIILLIILLLFGGKKLPELSRSLGKSAKELRKGFEDGAAEDDKKPKTVAKAKKPTKS